MVNAMAAFSSSGVVAVDLTTTTVKTETFFDYARGSLIPNMLPQSIVIMDTFSVHHTREVVDLFSQAGILVMLLPPYSPNLNPAEEAFSYVKAYLRKHDTLLQALTNPTNVILSAFASISEEHCKSWIKHFVIDC